MRQSSIAPNRGSANSAAAAAKLLEKRKEYDAVAALARATELYLNRIECLSDDCEVMANAGEVFGEVLGQWPRMFQTLNLFLASRTEEEGSLPKEGELLVRLPIDELQQEG